MNVNKFDNEKIVILGSLLESSLRETAVLVLARLVSLEQPVNAYQKGSVENRKITKFYFNLSSQFRFVTKGFIVVSLLFSEKSLHK
jgi:hypothetical protein